jgi:hypothetical protein
MANIMSGCRIRGSVRIYKKKATETSCGIKTREKLGTLEMSELRNTR